MQTINKKSKIIKKNILSKMTLATGITVSMMFVSMSINDEIGKEKTSEITQKHNPEYYNTYMRAYVDSLKKMDLREFDSHFIDTYNNVKYLVNNQEYDSNQVYIVELEDNSKHLIIAGENNIDIMTNTKMEGKKINICCFKESTVFYQMYLDGIIKNNTLVVDNNLSNYVNSWDGKRHSAIPALKAESEASDVYRKKYGR